MGFYIENLDEILTVISVCPLIFDSVHHTNQGLVLLPTPIMTPVGSRNTSRNTKVYLECVGWGRRGFKFDENAN
jgi:hypothetical protein